MIKKDPGILFAEFKAHLLGMHAAMVQTADLHITAKQVDQNAFMLYQWVYQLGNKLIKKSSKLSPKAWEIINTKDKAIIKKNTEIIQLNQTITNLTIKLLRKRKAPNSNVNTSGNGTSGNNNSSGGAAPELSNNSSNFNNDHDDLNQHTGGGGNRGSHHATPASQAIS